MGQEIGLSKEGLDNTYNVVKINNMRWDLVDERFEMVKKFKAQIELRKFFAFTKIHSYKEVENVYKIEHWDNGVYCVVISNETFSKPYKEIVLLINPLNQDFTFEFDNEYALMYNINDKNGLAIKNGIIPNISLSIYYR